MLVRLGCCLVIAAAMLAPSVAHAGCSEELSKLMSRDTENLTTRFQRISKQIENSKGSGAKLVQEQCRIARQLKPKLEDQLAAIKQSGQPTPCDRRNAFNESTDSAESASLGSTTLNVERNVESAT